MMNHMIHYHAAKTCDARHGEDFLAPGEQRPVHAEIGVGSFVERGALLYYYTDWLELRRRAAGYVDKIFKGAKPGELPVEQPSRFEFIVNLKTAHALGLTIPLSLLDFADKVIE